MAFNCTICDNLSLFALLEQRPPPVICCTVTWKRPKVTSEYSVCTCECICAIYIIWHVEEETVRPFPRLEGHCLWALPHLAALKTSCLFGPDEAKPSALKRKQPTSTWFGIRRQTSGVVKPSQRRQCATVYSVWWNTYEHYQERYWDKRSDSLKRWSKK